MKERRFRTAAVLSTVAIGLALSSIPTNASPLDLPTVVMVHGAWADTSSWDGEIGALQSRGFQARAVANPLHDLNGDAESVATFVRSIDGPVILVGHSYGGSVISQAAQNCPNVRALVFVDAFIPEPGESAIMLNGQGSALTERPEEQLFDKVPNPDGPPGVVDLLLKRNVFLESFASDIPAERADKLWATQRATSTAAVTASSTAAAWKTIPSWAFISTARSLLGSHSPHNAITSDNEVPTLSLLAKRRRVPIPLTPGPLNRPGESGDFLV